MAAAGDADEALVRHVEVQGLFPVDAADDGNGEDVARHAGNDLVQAGFDRDELALWPQSLMYCNLPDRSPRGCRW